MNARLNAQSQTQIKLAEDAFRNKDKTEQEQAALTRFVSDLEKLRATICSAGRKAKSLTECLESYYGEGVIVLIDEYDAIQQSAAEKAKIVNREDERKARPFIREIERVCKSFYSVLIKVQPFLYALLASFCRVRSLKQLKM